VVILKEMIVKIIVKPSSRENKIIKQPDHLLVHLKAPADKNKANLSLIKLLTKHFNKQVRIRSGLKSREKLVEF